MVAKAANIRTFMCLYRMSWKKHLNVAGQVQVGTCTTCEQLKDMRRKACLAELKDAAAAAQRAHVEAVLRDRKNDARAEGVAEDDLEDNSTMVAHNHKTGTKARWNKQNLGVPAKPL